MTTTEVANTGISSAPPRQPSPPPTPSPSPFRPPTPARIFANFNTQAAAAGTRLWFEVDSLAHPDADCNVHTLTSHGRTLGLFDSDCTSWKNTLHGVEPILFYVYLRNPTKRAVTASLANFILTSTDGRTHRPTVVTPYAAHPPAFFPVNGEVPPRSNIAGWVAFDGRAGGLVPASLSYVDGKQTLIVKFTGKRGVT